MFESPLLGVAIGLVFVYLMLSLVVSACNELVSSFFGWRGQMLWEGVARLLGNRKLADQVYDHPLIQSLCQTSGGRPSYIPPRTFALAVLDGLTAPGTPPPASAAEVEAAIRKLSADSKALAIALTVLLHDAAHDMESFKRSLEQWFDNSMGRVNGWYKRRTQWAVLLLSALVTIWANADTLKLANVLWRDPSLRSAIVAQAKQYATQAGAAPAEPATTGAVAQQPLDRTVEAASQAEKSMARVYGLSLPLGWKTSTDPLDARDPLPAAGGIWAALVDHGLGWLLTTLAISLGAPFWFDALNRLISVRGSGKPVPAGGPAPAVGAAVAAGPMPGGPAPAGRQP